MVKQTKMTWHQLQKELSKMGFQNFESVEHFDNWLTWDFDATTYHEKQQEKKLKQLLYEASTIPPVRDNLQRVEATKKRAAVS